MSETGEKVSKGRARSIQAPAFMKDKRTRTMVIFIVALYLAVPFQFFWSKGSTMSARADDYRQEQTAVTSQLNEFKTSDDRAPGWKEKPLTPQKAFDPQAGASQDNRSDEYDYQEKRFDELLKAIPNAPDSPSLGRTFAGLVEASGATIQTLTIQPIAAKQPAVADESTTNTPSTSEASTEAPAAVYNRGENCIPGADVGNRSVVGGEVSPQAFTLAISGQRSSIDVLFRVLFTNTRDLQGRLVTFDSMKIDYTQVGEASESRLAVTGTTFFVDGLWQPVTVDEAGTVCGAK